jgi:hypothetical protein
MDMQTVRDGIAIQSTAVGLISISVCLDAWERSVFCLQVSVNGVHVLDDAVVEVAPTAHWEDTSSCSEGHEDNSTSSPEPVSCVYICNQLYVTFSKFFSIYFCNSTCFGHSLSIFRN